MHQNQTKGYSTANNMQSIPSTLGGTQPDAPHSAIFSMLHAIEKELSNAHEETSMLENKVEPIRATAPEGVSGECAPCEVMPTQMENQLRNIYDTVRYLAARIEKTHSELRI